MPRRRRGRRDERPRSMRFATVSATFARNWVECPRFSWNDREGNKNCKCDCDRRCRHRNHRHHPRRRHRHNRRRDRHRHNRDEKHLFPCHSDSIAVQMVVDLLIYLLGRLLTRLHVCLLAYLPSRLVTYVVGCECRARRCVLSSRDDDLPIDMSSSSLSSFRFVACYDVYKL